MSTARRIISGNVAAWCRIGVNFASQLCLVPVFLSAWDATTYGAWLALQSLIVTVQILDNGHSRFLSNEFLRLGAQRLSLVRRTFWSAFVVSLVLGAIQCVAIALLCFASRGPLTAALGLEDAVLIDQSAKVLILLAIVWWIFGSVGGVAVVVLAPFGYYPRMAWWGVAVGAATAVAPAVAAAMGGGLLHAGVALAAATTLMNIPICIQLAQLMRRCQLYPVRPSRKIAMRNLLRSQVVTTQNLFETLRQQGARIVLAPLAGTAAVAGFSTMRTGANVALQGLQTVTSPLLPELMRFVSRREEEKIHSALATVWLVLAFVMAPAALVLQIVVQPLFDLWTQGKIEFDPLLFALLTLTVLVYALAQPAAAVVNGNNLLRPQLTIAIMAGVLALGLMFLLVPSAGLRGAGLALLAGEIVSTTGYIHVARQWLLSHRLAWPRALFQWSCASVIASAAGVLVIAAAPPLKYVGLSVGLVALAIIAAGFWRSVPVLARLHMHQLSGRLKFWRRPAATPVGE